MLVTYQTAFKYQLLVPNVNDVSPATCSVCIWSEEEAEVNEGTKLNDSVGLKGAEL